MLLQSLEQGQRYRGPKTASGQSIASSFSRRSLDIDTSSDASDDGRRHGAVPRYYDTSSLVSVYIHVRSYVATRLVRSTCSTSGGKRSSRRPSTAALTRTTRTCSTSPSRPGHRALFFFCSNFESWHASTTSKFSNENSVCFFVTLLHRT